MPVGFVGPVATVGRPGEVHDTAKNPVLTIALGNDGNSYIYLLGVASTVAGSWVVYDELGATTGLDTDAAATRIGQPVAIATAAVVAAKYGWYGVRGSFSAGAATVADNSKVFATGTVFICDDTGTAGEQVVPATWRSADASSLATVQINHPCVGINVA